MRAALLDHHHESAQHGGRCGAPGGRRFRARPHVCADQGQPPEPPLHHPVRQQLLPGDGSLQRRRELDWKRRGEVLVDAVQCRRGVSQDHR